MKKYIRCSEESDWEEYLADIEDIDEEEAADELSYITNDVDQELGLFLEPSIQFGSGSIFIHDDKGSKSYGSTDYEAFNSNILDLAYSSSTKHEFKEKYKNYLLKLVAKENS